MRWSEPATESPFALGTDYSDVTERGSDGSGSGESDSDGWQQYGELAEYDELAEQYGEPEEPDPDAIGPEIPEVPDPTEWESEPDAELQFRFWGLVAVFNVALLALSLGAMFIAFEGNLELGSQLLLAGGLLGGYGYYRYRSTKATLAEQNG